jgi:transposase
MSEFFWFSDVQWSRIEPLLPTDTRGKERVDDRRVLSGIVHALRNGWSLGQLPARGLWTYGARFGPCSYRRP